ncbi:MAG: hypothetical protein AAGI23_09505 [Bacteroidota bacterium]
MNKNKERNELKQELEATAQLLESLLPILQNYQKHYTLPDGLPELVQAKASSLSDKSNKL